MRCLWKAPGLKVAVGTVEQTAAVENCIPCIDPARGCQAFPGWADIGIGAFVIAEVLPREGPILALGPVEDGDVRGDLLLLDEPVQHRRRPVGGIAREPLRPEAESFFGPLNHRSGGTHLGLADGA